MLKKIGKPIAMYAKSVNLGMPIFDKPTGLDLMAGDWVAPYGKGINADVVFEAHLDLFGVLDHMVVGQDVTVFGNHNARAIGE